MDTLITQQQYITRLFYIILHSARSVYQNRYRIAVCLFRVYKPESI